MIDHRRNTATTEAQIRQDVAKHGFHTAFVEGDGYLPRFSYTIGLFHSYGHPEIICFGLKASVLNTVLIQAGQLVAQGESLRTNHVYTNFLEAFRVQFLMVDEAYYADYFGEAGHFYQGWHFPVLQLIWPDQQQRFPWEAEFYAPWKYQQPLLDRNVDFRFYEEKNLGVYTTWHVLEGKPILYVYHNSDGNWQFHSEAQPRVEDAEIVCLEDITRHDLSVNAVYHLPFGWRASRTNPEAPWRVEEE